MRATNAIREIVYRDQLRYTYPTLIERVARLANVLTAAGVKPGDTVAVMDWDSHRYLECMFAIPMIGAVLQTINIRLSPEQITYTMNHAGASSSCATASSFRSSMALLRTCIRPENHPAD